MAKYKKKIFWKVEEGKKRVFLISWDDRTTEYYSFVRQCVESNYHQVSLTSEMMIEFFSMYSDLSWEIYKIEMMEEDDALQDEIEELLETMRSNKRVLIKLIDKLRYLAEETSIEIKKIYIIDNRNDYFVDLCLQVNGIIGMSAESSELEHVLTSFLEDYLNR